MTTLAPFSTVCPVCGCDNRTVDGAPGVRSGLPTRVHGDPTPMLTVRQRCGWCSFRFCVAQVLGEQHG